MENIAERIQELIQAEGLTNTEFAKRTEINPAIVSHILSGRNKPSLQVITNIKESFTNVNLDYLITGSGTLYNDFTNVNTTKEDSSPPPQELETPADVWAEPHVQKEEEPNAGTQNSSSSAEAGKDASWEKEPPAPASENKAVEQIVIFYADGSFKAYHP